MDFLAIDVETANANFASICQVGIVEFKNGEVANAWEWLVNPDDYFDEQNVSLHGVNENMVRGKPNWSMLYSELAEAMSHRIVVCHTGFDRTSVQRACDRYECQSIVCTWLDSAKVVRRTWDEFSRAGYGLKSVAAKLGISFKHHNAKEDARAAGEILIRAIKQSGIPLSEWIVKADRPIWGPNKSDSIERDGNPEGSLFGEVIVFTGTLSIGKREAATLAAQAGCKVGKNTTKTTTLLVVGDQDISRLAGHTKSEKHRKAEKLIAEGQQIRILGESDFQKLLTLSN